MYLTQMRLDMNNHRTLSAISAPNKLHGALESSFPGERQRNLWRIDSRGGQNYLLILSSEKPDLSRMAAQFAPPGETWQTKDYTRCWIESVRAVAGNSAFVRIPPTVFRQVRDNEVGCVRTALLKIRSSG